MVGDGVVGCGHAEAEEGAREEGGEGEEVGGGEGGVARGEGRGDVYANEGEEESPEKVAVDVD